MADACMLEGQRPRPLTYCPRCNSMAFDHGPTVGLAKEIYCRDCGTGYTVNVLYDGLYLIDEIQGASPQDGKPTNRKPTDATAAPPKPRFRS